MRSRTGLDENCFDFARNFEWKRFVVFESFYIVCKKQRDFVTLQKKKKTVILFYSWFFPCVCLGDYCLNESAPLRYS